MWFEETLSWTVHIEKMRVDIARAIGILNKFRQLLPKMLKLQLYYSLVYSRLQYCMLVWGTTTQTNKQKLFILQKKAVRFIEGLKRYEHSFPVFQKYKILNIDQILLLKLSIFIFNKTRQNQEPFPYIFDQTPANYSLRSAQYTKPRVRTNYGTQHLKYLVPDLLNTHPNIAEMAQRHISFFHFKKMIVEYILNHS